jgi:hypothetical protein
VSAAVEDVDVLLGIGVVARVEVAVETVVDVVDLFEKDGASCSLVVLDVETIEDTDAEATQFG